MNATHAINVHLAKVWSAPKKGELLATLAWGDLIEVTAHDAAAITIRFGQRSRSSDGSIVSEFTAAYLRIPRGKTIDDVVIPRQNSRVLKVNVVDVQQGDGAVIETWDQQVLLIDGGENQLFARYLAARYADTAPNDRKEIAAIVVTHGDADHFAGLVEVFKSEQNTNPAKRVFIHPSRVFHNGLVKRGTTDPDTDRDRPDVDMFGDTATGPDGRVYATQLVDDLIGVPEADMNKPFGAWKKALTHWNTVKPVTIQRLDATRQPFDFLPQGVTITVLGPVVTQMDGRPALPMLGPHDDGQRTDDEAHATDAPASTAVSASHTVNGHSIILQLKYGAFSFLFTGDLNDEAARALVRRHDSGEIDLRADVFKTPHHGSADFSAAFLERVKPAVSIVSSGDERASKDYIHPRATTVGALGRYSELAEPLVFVTEMVAFFEVEGWSRHVDPASTRGDFFAFSRAAYGMVKMRSDGRELLVYTDSGRRDLKEKYVYQRDAANKLVPAKLRTA